LYDEIMILMTHMVEIYNSYKIDTRRLKNSLNNYSKWLTDIKHQYNRCRSMSFCQLEVFLRASIEDGSFVKIVKNEKLNEFLRVIITKGKRFNYVTRQLE
ncbi:MAG: hypothetical protein PHR06_12080, partial [Candidatus Cloacimonetes bacterium]|nr:hypothetical protein [Candidatus Cloacimonadota bacterium]